MQELLKNTQFLKLWGNQILLQIAFNMCNYTALLIIADRTHSPFAQSQFYAAITVAGLVFGLVAGPVVDMTNRRKLMLTTDILLAVLFFLYIFAAGTLVPMLVIAFFTAAVAAFFTPAEAATIPQIVSERTLNHANSFFLFTLMGSVLLGYTITGPILQVFGGLHSKGEVLPFALASGLLLIGLVLRYSLAPIVQPSVLAPQASVFKKTLHLFWETVVEIKHNTNLSLPILLLIFIELMVGIMSVLLLGYVQLYLHLRLESISYVLMVPLVVGLVIGISVLGIIEKRYGYRRPIFLSCLGIGGVVLLLGILPHVVSISLVRFIAILAAGFTGICLVFVSVQARTVLQRHAPGHMHGRVFSFLGTITAVATPLPVLFLGFLADKISLLTTLELLGIGIIGGVVFANLRYIKRI